MKTIAVFLLLLLILPSCSEQKQSTVQGTVTFADGGRPDTVFIGLYWMSSRDQLGDPLYFVAATDPHFEIDALSDQYTIAVWAFGYECYRGKVLVADPKSPITVNVTLQRKGIPANFKRVRLHGDYCNWDSSRAIELVQEGSVWKLKDQSMLKQGKWYKFIVDNTIRYGLSGKKVITIKDWTTLNNVYQGEEIVFDPALYQQPQKESTAIISGYDKLTEFLAAYNDYKNFEDYDDDFFNSTRNEPDERYEQLFLKMIKVKRDSLTSLHDPYFKSMFTEAYLDMIYLHPGYRQLRKIYQKNRITGDTTEANTYLQSDAFLNFYTETLKLLQSINPNSYIVMGDFTSAFYLLKYYAQKPYIAAKFNVSEEYFYNYLIDFVKRCPKLNVCAKLLYRAASDYAREEDGEKVIFLINLLKKDYADRFYVGEGHADAVLSSIQIVSGKSAPFFAVKSLAGDSIKLTDFHGKYLFIDFWGSWCGPCRVELPNLRKLASEISNEKLQIIGLVYDDSTAMVNFLKEEPLPYPNALASIALLKLYGITGYPTTLLIGPDGTIIAKDIRGENLVKLVQEKMEDGNI